MDKTFEGISQTLSTGVSCQHSNARMLVMCSSIHIYICDLRYICPSHTVSAFCIILGRKKGFEIMNLNFHRHNDHGSVCLEFMRYNH